jgi:hypothetical protein
MESVIDTNDDALVDDLDILGEELVQSHLDLKGDVVKPSTTTPIRRSLFISVFHVVFHPSFP